MPDEFWKKHMEKELEFRRAEYERDKWCEFRSKLVFTIVILLAFMAGFLVTDRLTKKTPEATTITKGKE